MLAARNGEGETDVQQNLFGFGRLAFEQLATSESVFTSLSAMPNIESLVLLATALEFAKDQPNALDAWQAVVKVDPRSTDAQQHVVLLADATGQADIALDARRQLSQAPA